MLRKLRINMQLSLAGEFYIDAEGNKNNTLDINGHNVTGRYTMNIIGH
jgi:hypothetical protein